MMDSVKMNQGYSLIGISGVSTQQKSVRRKEVNQRVEPDISDGFRKNQQEPPAEMGKQRLISRLQNNRTAEKQEVQSQPEPVIATEKESTSGAVFNPNGTLSILEESDMKPAGDGGVNFAEMFGVDTGQAGAPREFTRESVEKYYLSENTEGVTSKEQLLTKEGQRLYETVKTKYLDSVPQCPYGSPTVYLTGGLPGSGKGYILSRVMGKDPQMALVDPDEIKKDILRDLIQQNPDLKGQISVNNNWSDNIHEVSSLMAKNLMADALDSGKDIIFDSSMASKNVDKYRNFAKTARSKGYKINGIITDVTKEVANTRAQSRAGKPTVISLTDTEKISLPGRLTTYGYISECAGNLKTNLNTYLKEGLFDQCAIFDNNKDNAPVEVSAQFTRVGNPDGTFTCKRKETS